MYNKETKTHKIRKPYDYEQNITKKEERNTSAKRKRKDRKRKWRK